MPLGRGSWSTDLFYLSLQLVELVVVVEVVVVVKEQMMTDSGMHYWTICLLQGTVLFEKS